MEIRQATIRIAEPIYTNRVSFDFCGTLVTKHTKPIEEACAGCDFWQGKFSSIQECQASQKKDAEMRGFVRLVCPRQFID